MQQEIQKTFQKYTHYLSRVYCSKEMKVKEQNTVGVVFLDLNSPSQTSSVAGVTESISVGGRG